MPYRKGSYSDYSQLIATLYLLKHYNDIGIYHAVVRNAAEINEEHWYEFAELGLEHVAPITYEEAYYYDYKAKNWVKAKDVEEERESLSDYPNRLIHFSSPEMQEYYRLCRLYEYSEGIAAAKNPYVCHAESHIKECCRYVSSVGIGSEESPAEVIVEICPEDYFQPHEVVEAVHGILSYFKKHLNELQLEMLKKPPVFLPALPAPKGGDACGKNKGP